MWTKLISFIIIVGVAYCSPVPQREQEEGYELQEPAEIPSELFPNKNVPTVPAAPPTREIQRFYKTPQDVEEPDQFYGTPEDAAASNLTGHDLFPEKQPRQELLPEQQPRQELLPEQPRQTLSPEQPKQELFPEQQQAIPSTEGSVSPSQMMGMPYDFEWKVNDVESNNIYSHVETSDGTITTGEYRVLLPDGRLQVVTFTDRGKGYEAKVAYEDYVQSR